MALPSSGQLSFDLISSELSLTRVNVGLGDEALRSLAEVPYGEISTLDFYNKYAPSLTVTYFGSLTALNATEAQIKTLPSSATSTLPRRVTISAGVGWYQYWASPVEFGPVQFFDRMSFFVGGWDGAVGGTLGSTGDGPKSITIDGVPYLVYRTDYPNLGTCYWEVQTYVG